MVHLGRAGFHKGGGQSNPGIRIRLLHVSQQTMRGIMETYSSFSYERREFLMQWMMKKALISLTRMRYVM